MTLAALLQAIGATPQQCVAFGDHMNDYEMLLACEHRLRRDFMVLRSGIYFKRQSGNHAQRTGRAAKKAA